MDFLFILGFKLGVVGAGYATILSQFISGVGCWAYLLIKFPNARPNTSSLHFNFKELFLYIKISIPMAFQFSIIGIGLIIQQNAVNGLDEINNATSLIKDLYATSYVNACKINNFASGILQSLGLTMVAFCGQNYGAKKIDRIKIGIKYITIISIIVSLILMIVIVSTSSLTLPLFSKDVPIDSIALSQQFLLIEGIFYSLLAFVYVYRCSLQGLNKSNITVIAGFAELIGRIIISILFTKLFGWSGLCFSDILAWVCANTILIPALIITLKKETRCILHI